MSIYISIKHVQLYVAHRHNSEINVPVRRRSMFLVELKSCKQIHIYPFSCLMKMITLVAL